MLDPSHPAASISLAQRIAVAPSWRSAHFDLRAFPKAWLSKPESLFLMPPYNYAPFPEPPRVEGVRTINMSFQTIFFNKYIHSSKFVRYPIKRKLKTAIELIVTRGARTEKIDPAGKRKATISFDESDVGADKWIKPDWTYVFMPRSELLLVSVNEAVGMVRNGLVAIMKGASTLEATNWQLRRPPAPKRHTSRR